MIYENSPDCSIVFDYNHWVDIVKFPWLEYHTVNKQGKMFCKVCRKFEKVGTYVTGCTNFKMDSLTSHHSASYHKANVAKDLWTKPCCN